MDLGTEKKQVEGAIQGNNQAIIQKGKEIEKLQEELSGLRNGSIYLQGQLNLINGLIVKKNKADQEATKAAQDAAAAQAVSTPAPAPEAAPATADSSSNQASPSENTGSTSN